MIYGFLCSYLAFILTFAGGIKIGELIFIGMGLGTEEGLSLAGLNTLKRADSVFIETYTGLIEEQNLENLEKLISKKIVRVDRKAVEDGVELLDEAEKSEITALITIGDPMSATTHIDLRLRAYDKGLKTRIIHGSSILTAAPGLCGLQHYKFGRTTTLAFPQGDYFPESPYSIIGMNLNSDMHTLVLLELTTDEDRIMIANDGIKLLLDLEDRCKKGHITENTIICAVGRAGSDSAQARAGYVKDLLNEDFGDPMHCLIIPGKLHFKEAEALVKLCGAPPEIMNGVD